MLTIRSVAKTVKEEWEEDGNDKPKDPFSRLNTAMRNAFATWRIEAARPSPMEKIMKKRSREGH
jgi:hypothetical protein